MDTPERIWIDFMAANHMSLAYDEAPEHGGQGCRDAYARADIHAAVIAERDAARAEVAEVNEVFQMRWDADMRAVDRWRLANPGNDLVLPDHADLVLFLAAERDVLAAQLADALDRIARLEGALANIAEENVLRPIGKVWRKDGHPSKHDTCKHGAAMYDDCGPCIAAYARAALEDRE